jgi:hypothetical protein
MAELLELIGQSFGRLTVCERAPNRPSGKSRWICLCECGVEIVIDSRNLRSGRSRSCGCIRIEKLAAMNGDGATHGMHGSPTYITWRSMIGRCETPSNASFENYGGRGIAVCRRWRESFPDFLADMGVRPEGKTLDRIDNERGYEPDNCRWATASEQMRNRRAKH